MQKTVYVKYLDHASVKGPFNDVKEAILSTIGRYLGENDFYIEIENVSSEPANISRTKQLIVKSAICKGYPKELRFTRKIDKDSIEFEPRILSVRFQNFDDAGLYILDATGVVVEETDGLLFIKYLWSNSKNRVIEKLGISKDNICIGYPKELVFVEKYDKEFSDLCIPKSESFVSSNGEDKNKPKELIMEEETLQKMKVLVEELASEGNEKLEELANQSMRDDTPVELALRINAAKLTLNMKRRPISPNFFFDKNKK